MVVGAAAVALLIPFVGISGFDLLSEVQKDERLRDILAGLDVPAQLGAGPEVLDGVDRVVTSPGISPRNPVLRSAEERGLPVLSEP